MKIAVQEAYLNEFKGNLLEFLLAQQIAACFQQESDFLQSLPQNFLRQLVAYEQHLRQANGVLAQSLPAYAQQMAQLVCEHLSLVLPKVRLVGKLSKGDWWQEADILLQDQGHIYPLSVKFSKDNAFVNTKSGGIKTFISKYFACFSSALDQQHALNQLVEMAFYQMSHQMHQLAGRPFTGKFDRSWPWHLPGELPPPYWNILQQYYQACIGRLFTVLQTFWQQDSAAFQDCLMQLLGHGNSNMYHLFAFHPSDYQDLSRARFIFLGGEHFNRFNQNIKLLDYSPGLSSFEISLSQLRLQIRVKPMNVFTTPALKINCSVKFVAELGH